MVFSAIYFVSFIWGGFLKEESENIPKALDLGNTSEGKRRDGGACVNESLFFKMWKYAPDRVEAITRFLLLIKRWCCASTSNKASLPIFIPCSIIKGWSSSYSLRPPNAGWHRVVQGAPCRC